MAESSGKNGSPPAVQPEPKAATGIAGLDDILCGGFTKRRLYLVEGLPGSGKTTLAMQFLIEGARLGEPVLYVTLSETEQELRSVALSHGWSLDGVTIHELVPDEDALLGEVQYTMFHPSEIELSETTRGILAKFEEIKPTRIVFDSLSEMRLLAGTPLNYRRQVLALKQYFSGRQCTVLMLDDLTVSERDLQVQSIAHGVVLLDQFNPEYGAERRRLRVVKYRGIQFRGGFHDYTVRCGGLDVFPRLVAADHSEIVRGEKLSSGDVELDRLLGGGLEPGTSTLVVGAPGTGKSSLTAQFVAAAAARGQSSAMFLFDEGMRTLLTRAEGLGLRLDKHIRDGRVTVQQIDPAQLSPGEFVHRIRAAVDERGCRIIVIDSLNGYMQAMPEERFLTLQLHELLSYLAHKGVATLLVGAQQGMLGSQMISTVDATYLADAVVLLRYFETPGEVRKAISIVKNRSAVHERSIREFKIGKGGITVSPPLSNLRGVFTGLPTHVKDDDGDALPRTHG